MVEKSISKLSSRQGDWGHCSRVAKQLHSEHSGEVQYRQPTRYSVFVLVSKLFVRVNRAIAGA